MKRTVQVEKSQERLLLNAETMVVSGNVFQGGGFFNPLTRKFAPPP